MAASPVRQDCLRRQPNQPQLRWFDIGARTNRHSPMIFAAKTTASGLIALLIAFTFNLDQPQWALLTVFIVSQPQSGLVLAKSFYRIIGTLIGAAVALLLVALFAQERVLFLGGARAVDRSLHLWLAIREKLRRLQFCPVRLHGGDRRHSGRARRRNAFFIANARVTEICLGIIVAATVSRVVLPNSLADLFGERSPTLGRGSPTTPSRSSVPATPRRCGRNCWARRSRSRTCGLRQSSRIARSATGATPSSSSTPR